MRNEDLKLISFVRNSCIVTCQNLLFCSQLYIAQTLAAAVTPLYATVEATVSVITCSNLVAYSNNRCAGALSMQMTGLIIN